MECTASGMGNDVEIALTLIEKTCNACVIFSLIK